MSNAMMVFLAIFVCSSAMWLFFGVLAASCVIFDAPSKETVRKGLNMAKKAIMTSVIWPIVVVYRFYKWYKELPERVGQ